MTMFKNMFKRGFWDDVDGLSLTDFIAIWVMIAWGVTMLLVVVIALFLMYKGRTMDDFWIEFLKVFADVPLAVVIGLFGKGAFGEFGQSMIALRQNRESTAACKEGNISDANNGEYNRV